MYYYNLNSVRAMSVVLYLTKHEQNWNCVYLQKVDKDALSYFRVRWLYFLAVIFAGAIIV